MPGNSTPGWQAFTQQQQQQTNSGGARGSGGGEWPALCRDASAMAAAWGETGAVGAVAAVAARHNKSFLVTAYGGQSRPLAHRSPSGVGQPGQSDCSAANRCYDEVCQAALVEGFHQAWVQAKGICINSSQPEAPPSGPLFRPSFLPLLPPPSVWPSRGKKAIRAKREQSIEIDFYSCNESEKESEKRKKWEINGLSYQPKRGRVFCLATSSQLQVINLGSDTQSKCPQRLI